MSNTSIKKITIFVLLFVISASLFSQQNQPYKEGYTYFFLRDSIYDSGVMKSSYSSLIPISVIKTEVNSTGNLTYNFNKTVNLQFYNDRSCYKKNTASNIGISINYMSNGQFYIISHFNDTIYFKTKDSVGSSWNLFVNNSIYPEIKRINIQLKSIKIDTVLGELDTIITYQYLPYNSNEVLDKKHPIYLKESKFALNHGFTETIDLRGFPYVFKNGGLKLCGRMKNDFTEKIGITGIWRFQIEDRTLNDEVQTLWTLGYPAHFRNGYIWKAYNEYLISKTIGREENDSQILLKLYNETWYYGKIDSCVRDVGDYNLKRWDSVSKVTINKIINKKYDTANYIPPINPTFDNSVSYYNEIETYNNSYYPEYGEYGEYILNGPTKDSCWYNRIGDPLTKNGTNYFSGIVSLIFPISGSYYRDYLVYFKKGNITKGTPYPFALGTKNTLDNNSDLVIYPNPANNEIRITNSNNYKEKFVINIIDLLGRNIISTTLNNNETIDISTLNNGVYLMEIIANGNKTTKKFVKQ